MGKANPEIEAAAFLKTWIEGVDENQDMPPERKWWGTLVGSLSWSIERPEAARHAVRMLEETLAEANGLVPEQVEQRLRANLRDAGDDGPAPTHFEMPTPAFSRECNEVGEGFCGTHSSVWPEVIKAAGGEPGCLYMQVMFSMARWSFEPNPHNTAAMINHLSMHLHSHLEVEK